MSMGTGATQTEGEKEFISKRSPRPWRNSVKGVVQFPNFLYGLHVNQKI